MLGSCRPHMASVGRVCAILAAMVTLDRAQPGFAPGAQKKNSAMRSSMCLQCESARKIDMGTKRLEASAFWDWARASKRKTWQAHGNHVRATVTGRRTGLWQ